MKQLTKKEVMKIVTMKRKGFTNRAIAEILGVHTQTVVKRVAQLRKLGYDIPSKFGRPPTL